MAPTTPSSDATEPSERSFEHWTHRVDDRLHVLILRERDLWVGSLAWKRPEDEALPSLDDLTEEEQVLAVELPSATWSIVVSPGDLTVLVSSGKTSEIFQARDAAQLDQVRLALRRRLEGLGANIREWRDSRLRMTLRSLGWGGFWLGLLVAFRHLSMAPDGFEARRAKGRAIVACARFVGPTAWTVLAVLFIVWRALSLRRRLRNPGQAMMATHIAPKTTAS